MKTWEELNRKEKAVLIIYYKHNPNSVTTDIVYREILDLGLLEMSEEEFEQFRFELASVKRSERN